MSCLLAPVALVTPLTRAGTPVPVYGGPTYTPGVGGYQQADVPHPADSVFAGLGLGNARIYSATGIDRGLRPLRWDTTGAFSELGNLGTQANGRTQAQAFEANAAGMVVGYSEKYTSGGLTLGERAVRWMPGSTTPIELGTLGELSNGSTGCRALAVNGSGVAAGNAAIFNPAGTVVLGSSAVRWDANSTAAVQLGNLGTPNANAVNSQSFAYDLNDAGTAVGYSYLYDSAGNFVGQNAARWDAGGTVATALGNLNTGANGLVRSQANAINPAGTVVGIATLFDAPLGSSTSRAVRWDAGATAATELGRIGTVTEDIAQSAAWAINSAGTTVGNAQRYDQSPTGPVLRGQRAVRWIAGGVMATELASLGTNPAGFTTATAYDINDSGFVAGWASTWSGSTELGTRAVVWTPDNVAIDLNTLIDPASGWIPFAAESIDNSNWVAGTGLFDPDGPDRGEPAYERLFLMQVPEPTYLGIALAFVLGTRAFHRRRQ